MLSCANKCYIPTTKTPRRTTAPLLSHFQRVNPVGERCLLSACRSSQVPCCPRVYDLCGLLLVHQEWRALQPVWRHHLQIGHCQAPPEVPCRNGYHGILWLLCNDGAAGGVKCHGHWNTGEIALTLGAASNSTVDVCSITLGITCAMVQANYDPASDEFIINTPTHTASKFWIGGAGTNANVSALSCTVTSSVIIFANSFGYSPGCGLHADLHCFCPADRERQVGGPACVRRAAAGCLRAVYARR